MGWPQKLDDKDVASEAGTYGVTSYVYRSRSPFHTGRVLEFLKQPWSSCKRLTLQRLLFGGQPISRYRDDRVERRLVPLGLHRSMVEFHPQVQRLRDDHRRGAVLAKWDEAVGDCCQEIVSIGQEIDVDALSVCLDECLLTKAKIVAGPAAWVALPGAKLLIAAVAGA